MSFLKTPVLPKLGFHVNPKPKLPEGSYCRGLKACQGTTDMYIHGYIYIYISIVLLVFPSYTGIAIVSYTSVIAHMLLAIG